MAISATVVSYLKTQHVPYDVVMHSPTRTSLRSADAAHIPPESMAKGVLLEDDQGYVMAVVPASYHINLGALRHQLGRNVGLATEKEIAKLFGDCELGAIPPIGEAYGIETVCDDSLMMMSDIYFEAGDHEELIHITRDQFMRLMGMAKRGHFSQIS